MCSGLGDVDKRCVCVSGRVLFVCAEVCVGEWMHVCMWMHVSVYAVMFVSVCVHVHTHLSLPISRSVF